MIDFILSQAKHVRDDGGRGDLDQHDVIEPDAVEAVLERDHTLDLVRLDHRDQHVLHHERRLARGDRGPRQPVGGGEDAPEIVGRMPPFGGEPGVVEVEPADHRADVERRLHGIQLVRGARHLRAVGNDGAGHDRSHQLGACGVGQRLEAATQRVDQAMAGRGQRLLAGDLVARGVVGDVDHDLVGLGTDVADGGGHVFSRSGRGLYLRWSIGTNVWSSGPM